MKAYVGFSETRSSVKSCCCTDVSEGSRMQITRAQSMTLLAIKLGVGGQRGTVVGQGEDVDTMAQMPWVESSEGIR